MLSLAPQDYTMEMGPMGPIGEGAALMLRLNRHCPWNQCLFCGTYKGKKFSRRRVDEIGKDIDALQRVRDLLETASWDMGLQGMIKQEVFAEVINHYPEIYGGDPTQRSQDQRLALKTLRNIGNWLAHGGERVFLQDANALFLKPGELTGVLQRLKNAFPTIQTVTSYARTKTCAQRSREELRELRDAGLSWCFVGLESGCEEVLTFMKKGAQKDEQIAGGQKLMDAGIRMAAFVMPGLAGNDGRLTRKHIQETIFVLNEIKPTEVRVRSLAVLENTPLHGLWREGSFGAPGEGQMIDELKSILEGLTFDCTFESLQLTNVFTLRGSLKDQKANWLERIDRYLDLPPREKARFLLHRYLDQGYLDFISFYGKVDETVENLIAEAMASLNGKSPDALEKVERATFAIKSKGIP